jgi:hypothetical protein
MYRRLRRHHSVHQHAPAVPIPSTAGPLTIEDKITLGSTSSSDSAFIGTINNTYQVSGAAPVDTPAFSPPGGLYTGTQTVAISTTTPGATIRYTLDSTAPNETTGTIYSAPFVLSGSATVTAIAYAAGFASSQVVTAYYTLQAVAPAFSPAAGVFNTSQMVVLTTATPGASIRYTVDGTTPTSTSGTIYVSPIAVTATTTIKAIAYAAGLTDSSVSTATYTISATPPVISGLSPIWGWPGYGVTVTGRNFGSSQGTSKVTFDGKDAGPASAWNDTAISVLVPAGATTGDVVATVNGLPSNGSWFLVGSPASITGLSPGSGPVGTTIMIAGRYFGASQGTSTVTFNCAPASPASVWTDTSITLTVPAALTAGSAAVTVTVNRVASNAMTFTVTPNLVSVSPPSSAPGSQVTVSGSGFGPSQGSGRIWLGSSYGAVVSWSDSRIEAMVASNSTTGTARVQQGGAWSNSVRFSVTTPAVSTITPDKGLPGSPVIITGAGFGAAQGNGQVWPAR